MSRTIADLPAAIELGHDDEKKVNIATKIVPTWQERKAL